MTGRIFLVPALWPSCRGSPRASAQRPLPSMMIATWVGNRSRRGRGAAASLAFTDIGAGGGPLRYPPLLYPPPDYLDRLPPPLLGQRREGQADGLAIIAGVKAQI